MRIVALADTHLTTGVTTRLAKPLLDAIERCDLVLHAGDVTTPETLEELSSLATVRCVLGNNDALLRGQIPDELLLQLEGVRVAVLHDSGSTAGRGRRLFRHFPDAHLVVYGHSHVPDNSTGLGGQQLFNPGSPTQRRAQPVCTYGLIELSDGIIVSSEICAVA